MITRPHFPAAALLALAMVVSSGLTGPAAKAGGEVVPSGDYDRLLDTYVRDGYVYYRALKLDRRKLDAYVNAVGSAQPDGFGREERLAFWLNAYNALVLRTVIDRYPINGRASGYPARSIRQIPGAFDRAPHQVAGRTLTLDQIEQGVLSEFQDPRAFLAIGRGAVSSGRLRSEAFSAQRLEQQLAEAAAECVSRSQCVRVDVANNTLAVSPIFSWREKDFVEKYGTAAPPVFSNRSGLERAVVALVEPKLLTGERRVLEGNTFAMTFQTFDWTLNDLTGRGGR